MQSNFAISAMWSTHTAVCICIYRCKYMYKVEAQAVYVLKHNKCILLENALQFWHLRLQKRWQGFCSVYICRHLFHDCKISRLNIKTWINSLLHITLNKNNVSRDMLILIIRNCLVDIADGFITKRRISCNVFIMSSFHEKSSKLRSFSILRKQLEGQERRQWPINVIFR